VASLRVLNAKFTFRSIALSAVCFFIGVFGACAALEKIGEEWSVKVGSRSDSSPAVGPDSTIYFGTWQGNLWAVKEDGTARWKFATGVEIRSSPAVAQDGTIYFGCRDRKFYAIRADGKRKWEFKTAGWVDSSPALAADSTIYFGSWDKSLYALNADGSRKWQFATLGPVSSSPAIGLDGAIYFGSHDTNFYAVAADGRRRWEFATGGQIVSSPALNKSECLYFTSQDGFLYALNLDGKLRWKLQTGGMTQSSPVLGADGTIYLGVNANMWAILPEGKRKWEQPTTFTDPFEASALVLADGTICHVSRYGMLMDFDTEQFGLDWMYFVGQQGYASPAIGAKGTIYTPSQFENFVALRTTVPLARTPWPKFRGNPRNTGNASDW
jgi:outer membrane protein assembly factor BamB